MVHSSFKFITIGEQGKTSCFDQSIFSILCHTYRYTVPSHIFQGVEFKQHLNKIWDFQIYHERMKEYNDWCNYVNYNTEKYKELIYK
jgi:hypothetical protein